MRRIMAMSSDFRNNSRFLKKFVKFKKVVCLYADMSSSLTISMYRLAPIVCVAMISQSPYKHLSDCRNLRRQAAQTNCKGK
jgi:hypothetical protein